jgi:molecular chaperone GrpE
MKEPLINEEDTDAADAADTVTPPHAEQGRGQEVDGAAPGTGSAGTDSRTGPRGGDREGAGETEVVALREEFEALNDRHLRLVAEFNNFRRRSEQERLSAWARAQADLVGKYLDVLDDLQRVAELDLSNATVEGIMEGIDLVERKFVRTLADAGVEMIDPTGEPFDPERMEAMMRVPAENDGQADTVAQVFQKGYSLKGILVRPARVSVFTQG